MKKIIAATICILISITGLQLNSRPDGFLHVYFLNVGQGDSIFIRTPQGNNILVDGGPKQNVLQELKTVLPFFDNTIDYMVLTHPDSDHIEGLLPIIDRYQIKNVLFPGAHKNDYLAKKFLTKLIEKNISVTIADDSSDILLPDEIIFDVIYPFSQMPGVFKDDINDTSLVAKLIYGENEILLTGDAGFYVEEKIIASKTDISADILKLGHHGSAKSTSEEFLSAINPKYGVISVGQGNSYGHPTQRIIDLLKKNNINIYRTDKDGRLEFIFSKNEPIEIKTETKPS